MLGSKELILKCMIQSFFSVLSEPLTTLFSYFLLVSKVGQFGKRENGLLQHNSEEGWDRKGDENFSSAMEESELEEAKY